MSCKAIREELGYKPKWDIHRGMSAYCDWYDGVIDATEIKRAV